MQKIKEAIAKIDLTKFYVYNKDLVLTGRDSEVEQSFTVNDNDFYMIAPYITLTDSAGKPLESGKNRHNEMKIELTSDDDRKYFESPVTVQALNRLHKNERYAGAIITDSHRYTIKLNGTNHPARDINEFPVMAEFMMIGYALPSNPTQYSIPAVTARIKGERQYSIDKKFSIVDENDSDYTDSVEKKITIGNEELYVIDANLTMTDREGRDILLSDELTDAFTIKMRSSDDYVMINGMNIRAFNSLWQSKQWKGFVMKRTTDYWFEIVRKKNGSTNFPEGVQTLKFDAKTANFTLGDTVTGGASSATGVIAGIVEDGAEGTLILTTNTGTFQDNETITGGITGSATVDGTATSGACLYGLEAQLTLQGYKLEVV